MNSLLKKLVPTTEEKQKLKELVKSIEERLNKVFQEKNIKARLIPGGSYAKDTYLRGAHDIDLFVQFNQEHENISVLLKECLTNAFKKLRIMEVPASRNYYKTRIKGYEIEFVPVYEINTPEQAKNMMDVSPLHVKYINEALNPGQKNDVRLLKHFFKLSNVYGAESHIQGFSGFVTELLIAYYGSFKKCLEALSVLPVKTLIDPRKTSKSGDEFKNYVGSPLIIIDPVQPGRNAAAALSYDKFYQAQLSARQYLRTGKIIDKRLTINKIKLLSKKRGTKLIIRKLRITGNKTTFCSKALKHLKSIVRRLEDRGYSVYSYNLITEKDYCYYVIELETLKLSECEKHYGPPLNADARHYENFAKKWGEENLRVERGVVFVDVRRENLKDLLNNLFKE